MKGYILKIFLLYIYIYGVVHAKSVTFEPDDNLQIILMKGFIIQIFLYTYIHTYIRYLDECLGL